MKKFLIPGAAAMLIASPAFAQQKPTMDQIMKELEALSGRVGRLEQDNAQLRTENAELKSSNDRLAAESAGWSRTMPSCGPKTPTSRRATTGCKRSPNT